ncbi:hypothetical protein HPB50_022386 [Hyalomma asiaticum]|uniref:Uncharacterized protein n=1 Tax=Hyalomma asiaticum TaxID=266040 RepID=A0ACB7S534_HYAAI|nr:hypothetical protein HPB50_022386 [Hyalomma asiaticum]
MIGDASAFRDIPRLTVVTDDRCVRPRIKRHKRWGRAPAPNLSQLPLLRAPGQEGAHKCQLLPLALAAARVTARGEYITAPGGGDSEPPETRLRERVQDSQSVESNS